MQAAKYHITDNRDGKSDLCNFMVVDLDLYFIFRGGILCRMVYTDSSTKRLYTTAIETSRFITNGDSISTLLRWEDDVGSSII
ncbi:hypothetical protein Trydic_g3448 [Trypoxylus dichotomus]